MGDERQEELAATLERYLEYRRGVDEQRYTWAELAAFFTDDAVFVDPAWGRIQGIEEITAFLTDSMAGLEDWTFPVDHVHVDGDQVIVKFRQVLPGSKPDGTPWQQSGYSTLLYAGGGKFRYEEDVLNMVHLFEDVKASGYRFPREMVMPPANPDRDFRRPA